MERTDRPWTVYVLVALFVGGSTAGLLLSDRDVQDVLGALLGLGVAYAIWVGHRWAFNVSFMLASLCSALMAALLIFQLFLYETGLEGGVLVGLISTALIAALLAHPSSKRFASKPA